MMKNADASEFESAVVDPSQLVQQLKQLLLEK